VSCLRARVRRRQQLIGWGPSRSELELWHSQAGGAGGAGPAGPPPPIPPRRRVVVR
ncbi:hypothetical protein KI387_043519, partial [Taxus chinensis]